MAEEVRYLDKLGDGREYDVRAGSYDAFDAVFEGVPEPLRGKAAELFFECAYRAEKDRNFPRIIPIEVGGYWVRFLPVFGEELRRGMTEADHAWFQETAQMCGFRLYKLSTLKMTVWCKRTNEKRRGGR